EQAGDAARVDGRSDVYAVAATLCTLITGEDPPQSGPESDALLALPPVLRPIVSAAMARDPADRPGSARALARQLTEVIDALPDEGSLVFEPEARPTGTPPPSTGRSAAPSGAPTSSSSEDTWSGTAFEPPATEP